LHLHISIPQQQQPEQQQQQWRQDKPFAIELYPAMRLPTSLK
jgi:hypothetical protein